MKVLLNSFRLNGRTLGFHPQTQMLQPNVLTQGLTLEVKGLTTSFIFQAILTHTGGSRNTGPTGGLRQYRICHLHVEV